MKQTCVQDGLGHAIQLQGLDPVFGICIAGRFNLYAFFTELGLAEALSLNDYEKSRYGGLSQFFVKCAEIAEEYTVYMRAALASPAAETIVAVDFDLVLEKFVIICAGQYNGMQLPVVSEVVRIDELLDSVEGMFALTFANIYRHISKLCTVMLHKEDPFLLMLRHPDVDLKGNRLCPAFSRGPGDGDFNFGDDKNGGLGARIKSACRQLPCLEAVAA
ncbi:MAG: hypothetical protein NTZ80_01890 [Patescibacteria group bacterium]|nr:hypothetical protein [Patescibacteria group bacterium]